MPPRRTSEESDDEPRGTNTDANASQAAAAVVRLALFHEYRRAPLRRQTIRSVIPESTNFVAVFARAQQQLASTFGMQLVELRARHKGDVVDERAEQAQALAQAQTQATQATQTQRRKGKGRAREGDDEDEDEDDHADAEGQASARAKGKKKAAVKTGSYVLRNILPPRIVAGLAVPAPLPIFEDGNDSLLNDEAYTKENEKDSGALIPWEKADPGSSIELLGIRTVVLCLILTMGRSADDLKLMSLLRRLGLRRDTILPFGSADGHRTFMSLETYMDHLAKQNYLEKIKVPNPSAPDGMSIEWRWGSREAEFSEEAALAFLERIFLNPDSSGDDSNSEDDEGNSRANRRNRPPRQRTQQERMARFERKRKQLREDVERAAGGPLFGEL